MAQNLQWEPMPEMCGKVSKKNTKTIFVHNAVTKKHHTQVREKERDYTTNPLSDKEKYNRAAFKAISAYVKTLDESKIQSLTNGFNAQKKYKTLNGFIRQWYASHANAFYKNLSKGGTISSGPTYDVPFAIAITNAHLALYGELYWQLPE